MGTKAIDPQAIRNVTIIGGPAETRRLTHRMCRGHARIEWITDRIEHTIHLAQLPNHAPNTELERAIRVADGVIAVVNAARHDPRLETVLRVADDHQTARLCLVTGLEDPAANFDRCLRTIADTRGAAPLAVQMPLGAGTEFAGVLDLVSMWALEPMAGEFFGDRWSFAEQRYRTLADAVLERDAADYLPREIPPELMHAHIRRRTRIGDAVPVLCDGAPLCDDPTPVLDAIVRYLPSPMHVCQPEHALDY